MTVRIVGYAGDVSNPPVAPAREGVKCTICDEPLVCRWTDTHGIGACFSCGVPYRIFHYGPNKERLNAPPSLAIKPEWISLHRQYWREKGRNVDPGAYNFPGSTYEVASLDDFECHANWFTQHEAEWPKEASQKAD